MERSHKTWGTRWNAFGNSTCEVSILDLNPNQRCSFHRHQQKYNLFFVIRGELFIKTTWGIEKIDQGQVFTTRPGEWHEFQTHTLPALVMEVMYVQYDPEDIQRDKLGGPLDE
jgi:mannose-6-phosphate isomerase-like protein (cupin superfamily)